MSHIGHKNIPKHPVHMDVVRRHATFREVSATVIEVRAERNSEKCYNLFD
jgi:hypothetical protein